MGFPENAPTIGSRVFYPLGACLNNPCIKKSQFSLFLHNRYGENKFGFSFSINKTEHNKMKGEHQTMKKGLFILATIVAAGLLLPPYGFARTVTIPPTDDAHVFSLVDVSNWNYGAVTNLVVNKAFDGNENLTQERRSYLKFDLTSLAGINPADVMSVTLHLFVNTTAGGQVVAYHSPDIYSTSSDQWVQGNGLGQPNPSIPGITWNNKPSLAGEPLMGISPNLTPNRAYYTIDLLAGGKSWVAADLCDHFLSVALLLPDSVNTSTAYYFCSTESNPAACSPPYLEVQVADVPSPAYAIVGVGDFNGDTKPDVLWRHTSTGANAVWLMDGVTLLGIVDLPALCNPYTIVGVGDFNADTKPDILWRNTSTGANAVWLMDGVTLLGIADLPALPDLNYAIVGVGDFNADTKPDILWRNTSTGANAVWLMDGVTNPVIADLPALPDLNYAILGVGDFNADTKPDILWRNTSTGANAVWLMNGVTNPVIADLPALPDLNYAILGVGDFNADTKPDILWRNTSTGANAVWLMNGVTNPVIADLPWLH